MILRITNEVSVWQVIENMKYFDVETLQQIHFPGFLAMQMTSCTYSDEQAVISAFRGVKELLEHCGNEVEAARRFVSEFTVFDMLQDMVTKAASKGFHPMFMHGEEKTFEFWLKMYQRLHVSRALVLWSHYNHLWV